MCLGRAARLKQARMPPKKDDLRVIRPPRATILPDGNLRTPQPSLREREARLGTRNLCPGRTDLGVGAPERDACRRLGQHPNLQQKAQGLEKLLQLRNGDSPSPSMYAPPTLLHVASTATDGTHEQDSKQGTACFLRVI